MLALIKEYCFYINNVNFNDGEFNFIFISFLRAITEKLQSVLNGYELDLGNDLPKSSHEIVLYIEKLPVLRIRIFREECLINQYTETVKEYDFFEVVKNLLINTTSMYVKLLDEAKNARKH